MAHKVVITFNCPVDIDRMPDCEGGKFCTQCSKEVLDYRNKVNTELPLDEGCGRFTVYQVHKPFNNWKDIFVSFAQYLRERGQKRVLFRRITMALSVTSLFLVGCSKNSGYCGGYGQSPSQFQNTDIKKQAKRLNSMKSNSKRSEETF